MTGDHIGSVLSPNLNTLLPLEYTTVLLLVHMGVRNEGPCVLAVVGYLDLVTVAVLN